MNKLDDSYTLWLHNIFDNDWSINGYKKIYTFNTLEDGISLIENINSELVEKTMLFLMKNNIKPIWEDEKNYKGGCFSYKINNTFVYNIWKNLVYRFIGNTINEDENIVENITGVSISPKKTYCIIKIWISNIDEEIINNINFKNFILEQLQINDKNIEDLKYKDPFNLHKLCDLIEQQCIFKKHNVLY
jgi:translation initiation factor 4E